jgi:ABC-2 type transport system permease protein
MSGIMLSIAKFTPLYGFGGLARWPILEGYIVNTTDGLPSRDSVWLLLANYGAWLLIFGVLAIAGVRRSRGRL